MSAISEVPIGHVIQAAQKTKAAAAVAKSEIKKSAAKVAKKAPKSKKALKRMVSEIDAEDASKYACGFCEGSTHNVLTVGLVACSRTLGNPCVCISDCASCCVQLKHAGSSAEAPAAGIKTNSRACMSDM